jgi:type IV pilus assembly protein PilC
MVYRYLAYRADGTEISGVLEADSTERAEEILWQNELTVVRIRRQRRLPALGDVFPTLFGVKRKDLILFSRQLATLLDSGVGILTALRILEDQAQKAAFKKVIHSLGQELQTGALFSEALGQYPDVFPNIFLRLVEVGEGTGSLQSSLRQIATYLEKDEMLSGKIKGAMAYPAFVLLLAGGAVFIMLNFALPSMMTLFTEFNAELPLPTRILLALVDFFQAYSLYLIILIVGAIAAIGLAARTERGKRRIDWVNMHMPMLSQVVIKGSLARFSRTLSILLVSGVNITEALNMVIMTTSNLIIRDALVDTQGSVLVGQSISKSLTLSGIFPPMLTQMIGVGEETGTLQSNLETLADIYEEETDRAINRVTGMLAPALILLVGGFVAFIAVSVIMPMYSIFQQIN